MYGTSKPSSSTALAIVRKRRYISLSCGCSASFVTGRRLKRVSGYRSWQREDLLTNPTVRRCWVTKTLLRKLGRLILLHVIRHFFIGVIIDLHLPVPRDRWCDRFLVWRVEETVTWQGALGRKDAVKQRRRGLPLAGYYRDEEECFVHSPVDLCCF